MLISTGGEQEKLACFEPDSTSEALDSCSINWKNQFYIFGGWTKRRQISRISGYKLERLDDLPFDHYVGACSVIGDQFVFLCFDYNDANQCRRSTGPPIGGQMYDYDVTFYDGNYYYFGGVSSSRIICLNGTSWTWSSPGQLNSSRSGHGAISVGNIFMVVGGWSTEKNEACILENEKITCNELSTSLSNYHTPILFLVDENYRNC